MIAVNFDYIKPASLAEALALLADGSAKPLAGGMSLIPMMKLRLAAPEKLVDLSACGLTGVSEGEGGWLRIGAMTTHHELATSELLRSKCPLLAETAANIGDVQVRNRGTIGGSVAHADPAADYPAALVALYAQVIIANATGGTRKVAITDFIIDAMTVDLNEGELITEIHVPSEEPNTGVCYRKVVHPASGYAVVGIAVRIRKDPWAGNVAWANVGVTGLASKAFRAGRVVVAMLEGGPELYAAGKYVGNDVEVMSDMYASAEYRLQLAQVHTNRAIATALSKAS
jgi:aerobic carbon-monoxide dehydrogenase medium subunit